MYRDHFHDEVTIKAIKEIEQEVFSKTGRSPTFKKLAELLNARGLTTRFDQPYSLQTARKAWQNKEQDRMAERDSERLKTREEALQSTQPIEILE